MLLLLLAASVVMTGLGYGRGGCARAPRHLFARLTIRIFPTLEVETYTSLAYAWPRR
jgi:hypothetical protein